jgi:hypothetical protein
MNMSLFCTAETLPPSEMQQYNVTYMLPQRGTTIKASIRGLCEMDEFFYGKPGAIETYYTSFKKAKCNSIPLYWNKNKALFELSK